MLGEIEPAYSKFHTDNELETNDGLNDEFYIICDERLNISFINEAGAQLLSLEHREDAGKLTDHLYWIGDFFLNDSPLKLDNIVVFPKSHVNSESCYLVSASRAHLTDEFYLRLVNVESTEGLEFASPHTDEINKTLAKIAEYSNSTVIVIDENGLISYINQGGRDLFSYSNKEVIGKKISDIGSKFKLVGASASDVMAAIRSGEELTGVSEFYTKHGKHLWLDFQLYPVATKLGEYKTSVIIARDTTDKIKVQKDLASAQLLLAEASIERTRLLANISHELRTPLTSIKGILNEISTNAKYADDAASLQIALHAADSLNAIIGDMLSFARGSIDHVEIIEKPVRIESYAMTIEGLAKQKYGNPQVNFSIGVKKPCPRYLLLDALHLQQVLVNLISNAYKFCKVGSIHVVLSCEAVSPANNDYTLVVQVFDTGIGIEESKLASIFKPFRQLDNQPSRASQGLGLGLAIVKKLVSMMKGTIEVSSVLNEGTQFTLRLPTKAVQKKTSEQTSSAVNPPSGLHILVVDDNDINAAIVQRHLSKFGNTVDIVFDGKQAVQSVESKDYDLVFMDIQMPVMDGFEATSIIRSGLNRGWEARKYQIPIIGFTADSTSDSIDHCSVVGMNTVVHKPIDYTKLYEAIEDSLLPIESIETRPDFDVVSISDYLSNFHNALSIESNLAAKLAKIFDLNVALSYAEGDLHFLRDCFASFLQSSDDLLDCLGELAQSEMDQYLAKNIEYLSHKIASSAGMLGANKLSKQSKKISETIKKTGYADEFEITALRILLEMSREGSNIILTAFENYNDD